METPPLKRWLALLLLLVVPAISWGQDGYLVGPRDVLRVEVYGEAGLSGSQSVREDGTLFIPLVQAVEVAGLTPRQVAERISERLGDGYLVSPQVKVEVETYLSQKVSVVGAVAEPGEYYLTGPTTLLDVLARAGNADTATSAGAVRIHRADGQRLVVSLEQLMSTGQGNLALQADDVVTVPEGQFVYVSGEVVQPGAIVFWDGLTVTQALTKAGGPSETARLRGAYILREGERVPIDLKRILAGRESDVGLRPGDQLFLKESPL
jgi:polysaccharide export outer membrane protein